jgi:hypothetical protein
MIVNPNIWGALKDRVSNDIFDVCDAGAPTSGTSGTGVGMCGPGSKYTNTSTGYSYYNTNTKASPTWTLATPDGFSGDVTVTAGVSAIGAAKVTEAMLKAASTVGLGALRYAKATYDFAVDGGAVSLITPASNAIIPINAVILGGIIDVITPFTTSASGTMAIGTSAGSAANSIKAALAAASYTGLVAVVPVFTAATMFKMSAAGSITCTIATGALTAGKANIILAYVVGG